MHLHALFFCFEDNQKQLGEKPWNRNDLRIKKLFAARVRKSLVFYIFLGFFFAALLPPCSEGPRSVASYD